MSRTYKDKPHKLKFEPWDQDREMVAYTSNKYFGFVPYTYIWNKTTKPKKRKHVDTESHWYRSTPSWWTHLFMLKPQRRKGRMWENEAVKCGIEALEESDPPSVGKKPHIYYH